MARSLSNPVRLASPEKGVDGRTTLAGARAPLMTDGRIGDFWVDTVGQKLYGPKNAVAWPDNGLIKGSKGWTPVFAAVTDGQRRVQRVVDWAGGEGTKPATGQYVGATGLVTDIADAVDIRGAEGPEMLISGITDAAEDITDDSLLPTAQPANDNEKRAAVEVFDLGTALDRNSIAHAQASTVRKNIKRIRTQFYNPAYADTVTLVGGANYRRVSAEPAHEGKFRTADRWDAEGNSDSVNGGWWELDEKRPDATHFGAIADGTINGGGTDVVPAVQALVDYVSTALGGGRAFIPSGKYRWSSLLTIPGLVTLCGAGQGHSAQSVACTMLVADLSLPKMIKTTTFGSISLEDLQISREAGVIPAGTVGVEFTNTDSPMMERCFVVRHACSVVCNINGVRLVLKDCTLSQATETYLRFLNGPQLTLINVNFGQNGGADLPVESYIEVDASGGGKIDTFNAIRCQFNGSNPANGSDTNFTGCLMKFKGGYHDGDGIFNFVACHAEHFNLNGQGAVIRADSSVSYIHYITFDSACTISTSATNNNFFDIPDTCELYGFTFDGHTTFHMNLTGTVDSVYKIDGYLGQSLSCTAGRELMVGGLIVGSIALSGTISSLIMYCIHEGTFTDTSTSLSKSITATRLNGQSRWLTNALSINSFGAKDSAGIRGVNHALQVAGTDANTASELLARWSANASGPLEEMYKSRGATFGSHGAGLNGDTLWTRVLTVDDGTMGAVALQEGAALTANVTASVGGNPGVARARRTWSTSDSSGVQQERFSIEQDGLVKVAANAWNTGHLILGAFHLWVDASGRLRIKSGAPASDTDGAVVGAQS